MDKTVPAGAAILLDFIRQIEVGRYAKMHQLGLLFVLMFFIRVSLSYGQRYGTLRRTLAAAAMTKAAGELPTMDLVVSSKADAKIKMPELKEVDPSTTVILSFNRLK